MTASRSFVKRLFTLKAIVAVGIAADMLLPHHGGVIAIAANQVWLWLDPK